VPKTKYSVALALMWVATFLVLPGCSESRSRQAGASLTEACDKARGLLSKALALMSGPPYVAEVQHLPPSSSAGPARQPAAKGPLNPEAIQALNLAQDTLVEALADNPLAPDVRQAIARELLGRIQSLSGFYCGVLAGDAEGKMRDLIDEASGVVDVMNSQVTVSKYYDRLAESTPAEASKILREAEARKGKNLRLIEIAAKKARVLTAQRDALLKANEERAAEAGALRVRSRLAVGREGLDLFDEALKIEEEMNAAASRIADQEYAISSLRIERDSLELLVRQLEMLAGAARGTIEGHAQATKRSAQARQDMDNLLGESKQSIESILDELVQLSARAMTDRDKADREYRRAIENFQWAQRVLKKPSAAVSLSTQEAEAWVSLANLHARALLAQERSSQIAGAVERVYKAIDTSTQAPATLAKVGAYVADPEATLAAGTEQFGKAIELYERLLGTVSGNTRWIYQGKIAAAYVGLWELTGSEEAHDEAKGILDDLLVEDRDASPYMAPLVGLRAVLQDSP